MSTYQVRFDRVVISVAVTVTADDESDAADLGYAVAEEYLETVWGDTRRVRVHHSGLDGVDPDSVEELQP